MHDKIKDIVKRKEKYLNILEEKDRTGKMRKPSYKERVDFTIDEEIMIDFRRHCQKTGIPMSRKVEMLLKEFISKNKL
jgi:hypothetical protein